MADPKPPRHLSKEAKAWWADVAGTFVLEAHHLKVLTAAAEAWDRMQQARKEIAVHGILVEDRFGVPKANPACAIRGRRSCGPSASLT